MTPDVIPISPATQSALLDLATRTGKPAAELLDATVAEYRKGFAVAEVPGVDPADVWEAARQAEAGQLTPHADVFARLRVAEGGA